MLKICKQTLSIVLAVCLIAETVPPSFASAPGRVPFSVRSDWHATFANQALVEGLTLWTASFDARGRIKALLDHPALRRMRTTPLPPEQPKSHPQAEPDVSGIKNTFAGVALLLSVFAGPALAYPWLSPGQWLPKPAARGGVESVARPVFNPRHPLLTFQNNSAAWAQDNQLIQNLFIPQHLKDEASRLSPEAQAIVGHAADAYFQWGAKSDPIKIFVEGMRRLNAELGPLGYVSTVSQDGDGDLMWSFYQFDPMKPQLLHAQKGKLSTQVSLFGAWFVSGSRWPLGGLSLTGTGRTFIVEQGEQSDVQSMQAILEGKISLEPYYGVASAMVLEIVKESFPTGDDAEIATVLIQETIAHEILHAWYDTLMKGNQLKRPRAYVLPYTRHEFAAYLGMLAFSEHPYRTLLRHLGDLKVYSDTDKTRDDFGPIAQAILKGLAREMSGRLRPRQDRQILREMAKSKTPLSIDQAVQLVSVLRANKVGDEQLRASFRTFYEREIGPLFDELQAHLPPASSVRPAAASRRFPRALQAAA